MKKYLIAFEPNLCFTTDVSVIISVHITGFTHTSSGFNITHQKLDIIFFPAFFFCDCGSPAVCMSSTSCYWPVTFSVKKRTWTSEAPVKYIQKLSYRLISSLLYVEI